MSGFEHYQDLVVKSNPSSRSYLSAKTISIGQVMVATDQSHRCCVRAFISLLFDISHLSPDCKNCADCYRYRERTKQFPLLASGR